MAAEIVKVPDFLRNWPWQRTIHPYYDEVKVESLNWLRSFGMFDEKSLDSFIRCEFPKLACLTFAYLDRAQIRSACDLMVIFYVIDEYTDVQDVPGCRRLADIVIDALRNPDKARPENEIKLGEMIRQYWSNAKQFASLAAQAHFVDGMTDYMNSMVHQSEDRHSDVVRTVEEYWALRIHTGGCYPTFVLIEFSGNINLPEEVYNHPLLAKLRENANKAICAGNDVCSYNMERARGHALHNFATIVMYEQDCGPQEAINWIGQWYDALVAEFFACEEQLRQLCLKWGPDIDRQVRFYVDGLGAWVRGSENWHLEGERHFGTDGPRFERERDMLMLPRVEVTQSQDKITDLEGELIHELLEKNAVAGISIGTMPFNIKAN